MTNKNTNKGIKPRVLVNTGLLVIMAVVFGVLTCWGVSQVQGAAKNFRIPPNTLAICADDEDTDKPKSYICDTSVNNGEEVKDPTQSDLFLYERLMLSSEIRSSDFVALISTVGTMMTAASLVGAVVYFNHNRN